MKPWVDVASRRRGEPRGSEPRAWETRVGRLRLVVHRHVHWPADAWLMTCDPFFDCVELVSKDHVGAKTEASERLAAVLKEALADLGAV